MIIENAYTFERYRKEGVATVSDNLAIDLIRQRGYKRYKYYTSENNIKALKWGEKCGEKVYERILERHFLFRVTRETLEQYDPPIPLIAPADS